MIASYDPHFVRELSAAQFFPGNHTGSQRERERQRQRERDRDRERQRETERKCAECKLGQVLIFYNPLN